MEGYWLERTELLVGAEGVEKLKNAHVLVVGVGGVGGHAAEQLCRAGIGELTIVDGDVVAPSNINRQLVALQTTIGCPKVKVLSERLHAINPEIKLHVHYTYLKDEGIDILFDNVKYDFVVDAIDTLSPKVYLILKALRTKTKIISSMGAGGRIDPTQIRYADVADTFHCGLAKAVRKKLNKLGIRKGLPVVFSTEQANRDAILETENERNKKSTVGTVSYLPLLFGAYLSAYVIRKIIQRP